MRLRRAVKEDVERLWEICRGQTAEEFCLWGKGRGKELVNLVLDQAAGTLGLEEVKLIVYAGNLRAQRCYEACGFVRGKALLRPGRPDAWWMRADLRERRGGSQPSQRLKGV